MTNNEIREALINIFADIKIKDQKILIIYDSKTTDDIFCAVKGFDGKDILLILNDLVSSKDTVKIG